jgi:isopentenyldiphosphate isomerase
MEEKNVVIVDKNDNEIGIVPRSVHDQHIYRVAALWVTNSKNEILMAQRVFTKKHHPGKWGPAVAGTVDEGETYLSNIIKEAKEEIGIDITESDLVLGPKTNTLDKKYRHFTQWFFYTTDRSIDEFKYDETEVANVKWFTKERIQENKELFLESILEKLDLLQN